MSPGMQKAASQRKLTNINPLILAIPATCDFCASSLMFLALTMIPPAVYEMTRGIIVMITALLAFIFLGRKQYRHHLLGIVLVVAGVLEVGYVSVKGSKSSGGSDELYGIVLLVIA